MEEFEDRVKRIQHEQNVSEHEAVRVALISERIDKEVERRRARGTLCKEK